MPMQNNVAQRLRVATSRMWSVGTPMQTAATEQLARQNQFLDALSDTAVGLLQSDDLSGFLEALVGRAVALTGADQGFVHLVDEEEDCLRLVAAANMPLEMVGEIRVERGQATAGIAWQSGEAVVVNDYQAWEHRLPDSRLSAMKSAIGLPLKSGDRVTGVIGLGAASVGQFEHQDVDMLWQLSRLASIALVNAQLHKQARDELAKRAELMRQQELNERRLQALIDEAPFGLLLHGSDGYIQYVNRELVLQFGGELKSYLGVSSAIFFASEGERGKLRAEYLQHGKIDRVEVGLRRMDGSVLPGALSMRPFNFGGDVLTMISFFDLTERHRQQSKLEQSEQRYRELFNEASQNLKRARAIAAVSQAINSGLPRELLLEEVTAVVQANLAVDRVSIRGAKELAPSQKVSVQDGVVTAASPIAVRSGVRHDANSLSVPIVYQDKTWGFLVASNDNGARISKADRDMLVPVANQLSLALHERELAERIEHQAFHDELTQLPNRRLFETLLDKAIAQAERGGNTFATLFVDLDGFKLVNDTYGHHVGDLLLIEVAKRLAARVRTGDTLARMGGDEFAVVVTNIANGEMAEAVARLILAVFTDSFKVMEIEIGVGASIGVSIYPDHGTTSKALLCNADNAMYKAKAGGKNRIQTFR